MSFGFFNLGPTELIVVLFIVLIIFGPRKLPEIGKAFGEMLSGFRKGSKEDSESEKNSTKTEDKE